ELHDIEVEYAVVEDMQLSNDEMVIPSIPELPSQEILTTSSQMSQPSLLTSATNESVLLILNYVPRVRQK
ncbi:hypothetical protein AVEN_257475-1, partial [Araneus ventricosus]